MLKKYLIIKTTPGKIVFKKNKCLNAWTSDASECWQFSKQGAKGICDILNEQAEKNGLQRKMHYNFLEADEEYIRSHSSKPSTKNVPVACLDALEKNKLLQSVDSGAKHQKEEER